MSAVSLEMVGVDKLVARFEGTVTRMSDEIKTAMTEIVFYLVAYCKDRKLSGQVLHRRTGRLSGSIKGVVTQTAGSIIGDVASRDKGNKPLEYAAFWEYGFHGSVNVRAHVRRIALGDFAGELTPVRAYIRHIDQAARPFMKPTRDENLGFIQQRLEAAVTKANA